MSTIENYKKLQKNVSTLDDLDFAYLKKTGIEYIESLGGGLWSDLNDHDPGITMLEMVAYAITDLGARMNLPIETLIASEDDPDMSNQFYRAEEILPTCPVTPLDYRKLFIDIDGVRNCWIVPFENAVIHVDCTNSLLKYGPFPPEILEQTSYKLQGLNSLLVDYEPDAVEATVNEAITAAYNAHRNLCEYLVEIKPVCEKPVSVCASMELERDADQNVVHAEVIDAIQEYFATQIRRYSLKEMLDKGYRMDEIFEGPLLNNGFIDSAELEDADLRSEVRLSDIINLIMSVEGVISITNITINGCGDNEEGNDWLICIPENCKPVLAPTPDMGDPTGECNLRSVFNYKKDVLPVLYNATTVQLLLDEIQAERDSQNALALLDQFPIVPTGDVLDIAETTTIMNDFPETYGIGLYGLPASASVKRKAQAKQLKGYLMFFDQILATYFAHLGSIKDLFAMNAGNAPTYFTQAIQDIKGFEELIDNYPLNDNAGLSDELISTLDDNIARRNDILDHLLARFAEQFSEYAFVLQELYGATAQEMLIDSKEQFLAEYVQLSRRRGKGYDILGAAWDTENVSGVQHRVSRLSGIADYSRRDLVITFPLIDLVGGTYEWHTEDLEGNIILSSTVSYETQCEAHEARKAAIQLLLDTSSSELETEFNSGIGDGQIIGNIRINEVIIGTATNYSYSIIEPVEGTVVAEISGYPYSTPEELLAAILEHQVYHNSSAYLMSVVPVPEEGMFVVEHILLSPEGPLGSNTSNFLPICVENCEDICAMDPYSFRVSVVLPGTAERFSSPDFRNFMDKLIRTEMPSHILPRICWIEPCKLDEFQTTYKAFLEARLANNMTAEVLQNFINVFTSLHNVYPAGRLFDCESEDLTGKIVLGRSNI